MLAGNTYAMGVVADNFFAWSRAPGGSAFTQNGLTFSSDEGTAFVFADGTPRVFTDNAVYDGFTLTAFGGQTSLQVWGGDYLGGNLPPVPEPSEWAMLLAGLMVVAFVAKRQRRRNI